MGYVMIIFIIVTSCELLPETAGARRRFAVDWTRSDCKAADPEMVSEVKCWFVRRPKSTAMMNLRLVLLQDLTNYTARYRMAINSYGKYMDYIKGDLDMCVAMEQLYSNFLLELMMRELRRVGNLPLSCPYKKQTYLLRNFTLDPNLYPPFLPNLDWAFSLQFRSYGKMFAELNYFGTIRNKLRQI